MQKFFRSLWCSFILLVLAVGCTKDSDDVIKELSYRKEHLKSYHAQGELSLYTGKHPLVYMVEVKYKPPCFCRVLLKNKTEDITQILLRNKERSYLIAPQLGKCFAFEKDWSAKPGQLYLYQEIIASVINDHNANIIHNKDGGYKVTIQPNFYNPHKEGYMVIYFNKDLYPKLIEVFEKQGYDQLLLSRMKFNNFKNDVQCHENDFKLCEEKSNG
ncbi:MAG: sporulation protein YdcC [Bacillota bacterium]